MNKTTVRPGQPAVHPQSPLQPVYNVINVLRPDHIIRSYKRLNRRQRWAIIMSFASIVAMIAILTASIALMRHIRATSGDFLFDALEAPFNLADRMTPAVDTAYATVLPIQIDTIMLDVSTLKTFIPGISPAEEAAPVVEATAGGAEGTVEATAQPTLAQTMNDQLGFCLWSAAEFDPTLAMQTGCLPYEARYLTNGYYRDNGGALVHVSAVMFSQDVSPSVDVMTALKARADLIGRTGNYVIGVGPVDYFFSSTPELYTFTWAHNGWVYSISSPDMGVMEKAIRNFPY